MNKPTNIILIEAAARGLAWILAAHLSVDAVAAQGLASQIVYGITAVAVAGISLWHSWHDRKGGTVILGQVESTILPEQVSPAVTQQDQGTNR